MLTLVSTTGLLELVYLLNSAEIYVSYNNSVINLTFPGNDYTLYIYSIGNEINNTTANTLQLGISMNTLTEQQTNNVLLWHLNYTNAGNNLVFGLLQKSLYIKGLIFNQYYNCIEIYNNNNYFVITPVQSGSNLYSNNLSVSYYKNI